MKVPIVLVPLDGSRSTLSALPVACALARIEEATPVAVHVTENPVPAADLMRGLGVGPEDIRKLVIEQRAGDPAQTIIRLAREKHACAIVMSAHTGETRPVGFLGPTAARILREAPCPVVIVKALSNLSGWSLGSVLMPHDGTPATSEAIGVAMALARKAGARLHVLHVAAPGTTESPEPGSLRAPRYVDQAHHEWPAWAGEFVQRMACSTAAETSSLRLSFARGETAGEVVRFAVENSVDLIVLAWRGGSEPWQARVVRGVLHDATCPVMVLQTADARTRS